MSNHTRKRLTLVLRWKGCALIWIVDGMNLIALFSRNGGFVAKHQNEIIPNKCSPSFYDHIQAQSGDLSETVLILFLVLTASFFFSGQRFNKTGSVQNPPPRSSIYRTCWQLKVAFWVVLTLKWLDRPPPCVFSKLDMFTSYIKKTSSIYIAKSNPWA